jgi:hypothetical protein
MASNLPKIIQCMANISADSLKRPSSQVTFLLLFSRKCFVQRGGNTAFPLLK